MERYKLNELYNSATSLNSALTTPLTVSGSPIKPLMMGLTNVQINSFLPFITGCIYGYFLHDLVAYQGEDESEVKLTFIERLSYDIAVKFPYWFKKYHEIEKLLTTDDLSLLQTSKVTSSSQDETNSAGGSLQKGATTPTGVSATTSPDEINITIGEGTDAGENSIETNGFADKYSNHQQKFANASQIKGSRSGEILREGSIKDLLDVLEKLPSSFADEITHALAKHFIFDYEGEEKGYYND